MKNCWEVKRCGREPGGIHSDSTGVCPAAVEERLNGVHKGRNAGRACWVIAGTMCEGQIEGSFATKFDTCATCDFYQRVKKEESPAFMLSASILSRLREQSPKP